MGKRYYYQLVGSLPALPHFDRVERLPITRKTLELRLKMLEEEDYQILKAVESYLFWRNQPKRESDAEIIKQYHSIMELSMPPELKDFVTFRAAERTVLVGLRRKHLGLPAPSSKKPWGVGPWVKHIEKNWEDPDFRLGRVYPWVAKVRELLQSGETLELERFILKYNWKLLERFSGEKFFQFETVAAYVLKWDILQYWLGFNPQAARDRFAMQVEEVYGENATYIKH